MFTKTFIIAVIAVLVRVQGDTPTNGEAEVGTGSNHDVPSTEAQALVVGKRLVF